MALLKVGGGSAEYIFNIILVIGAFLGGGGLAEYIFNIILVIDALWGGAASAEYIFNIILVIDALLCGGDGTNNFNIEQWINLLSTNNFIMGNIISLNDNDNELQQSILFNVWSSSIISWQKLLIWLINIIILSLLLFETFLIFLIHSMAETLIDLFLWFKKKILQQIFDKIHFDNNKDNKCKEIDDLFSNFNINLIHLILLWWNNICNNLWLILFCFFNNDSNIWRIIFSSFDDNDIHWLNALQINIIIWPCFSFSDKLFVINNKIFIILWLLSTLITDSKHNNNKHLLCNDKQLIISKYSF